MARQRMVAIERDGLSDLVAAVNLSLTAGERLEKRLSGIAGGKRNLGLLRWVANKILSDVLHTMPNEQLTALQKNLENVSYKVGIKIPSASAKRDENGLWVSNADIDALSKASRERCLTCDLHGKEEQNCPLRRALDNLGSETEHEDRDCEYRWM